MGLDSLSAAVVYHRFDAERISTDYGAEWDLSVSGKWHHYAGLLKYADYSAAGTTPSAIARDTRKFWAQLEYLW